jgi:hypothetical protein
MTETQKFCFCGLALGKRYRNCAISLAMDLQKYHPGVTYLILTDDTSDFRDLRNVLAIKHKQDSIMFPYHDRRFAFEQALLRFEIAIQIDTDIRILKPLIIPAEVINLTGLIGRTENLREHLNKYQKQNLPIYSKIAEKLDIPFVNVPYVGEFIFAVAKNQGKEMDFIHHWGVIARYLELHKLHGADGPAIGLAATKAGLEVIHSDWPSLIEHEYVEHLKFSSGKNKPKKSLTEQLKFRINYHYRLNKARLAAMKDFNFYYD